MQIKRLGVEFTMGLVMIVGLGNSEARAIPFNGSLSGSLISTQIDTNGDGLKAGLSLGIINTNLGRFTSQGVGEFLPPLPAPVTCPSDHLEFPLLVFRGVDTHEKTGDQLFFEYTSGTACVDPATGTSSFSGVGNFVGGTGQFAGVTGSFEANSAGTTLVSDPAGNSFGNRTVEFTGTLIASE
jgi:hypothetical protein